MQDAFHTICRGDSTASAIQSVGLLQCCLGLFEEMHIFHGQGNLRSHIFDECDFIGCPLATIVLVKS